MILDQQASGSWLIYTGAALLYTALTFRGELPRREALIFSKDNARSLTSVLTIHALFLGSLLAAIWVARYSLPFLPSWLTETFNFNKMPSSVLELVIVFGWFGMHNVERHFLYVDANKNARTYESISEH